MFGNIKFMTFRIRHIIIFLLLCIIGGVCVFSGTGNVSTSGGVMNNHDIKLPIIMYHSVLADETKSGKYVITPTQFEQDLQYLEREGYTTIFLTDLIDYVYNGKPLPQKPIILTFDDGNLNNKIYICPLLEEYNQKAIISIVGLYTDKFSAIHDENPNYASLTWKAAKELIDSGRIEIQNHSYNMHSLGARKGAHKKKGETSEQYRSALIADLGKMQELCKEHLGYTPIVFTYPYGSVSLESKQTIKDIGFLASLSCGEGINFINGDKEQLYLLKRCIRTDKHSVADILDGE